MKNKIGFLIASVCVIGALTGCSKGATETTAKFSLPPELSDCKIFKLTSETGSTLTVVRCPLSETSTVVNAKGATPVVVVETNK